MRGCEAVPDGAGVGGDVRALAGCGEDDGVDVEVGCVGEFLFEGLDK